jgi:hypothetical protein
VPTPLRAVARILGASVSVVVALCVLSGTHPIAAQESQTEEQARLARRGAGIRVGVWDVRGLAEVANAEYSETPLFEGYLQHGLDRHLAMQNSIGFWRRSQEIEGTGGIGGTPGESVKSYVVPQFTSIRFFPISGPEQPFEPFVEGGAGISLGIDDRSTTSGGLLGGGGSGIAIVVGFGFKLGLGVEWRFTEALGLSGGGRYQWKRFLEDLGGERTYRGFAADVGITYRFQYD